MSKKLIRGTLAIAVLIATISVFTWYFVKHPQAIQALKHVAPLTLAELFGLYCLLMAVIVWIQVATLALCDISLGSKESTLLVLYSTIINFFGPLQSGPGFRGAYLKAKHNVSLKKYTLATLVYYGLYALFSGLLLVSFAIGWWILIIAVAVFLAAPLALRIPRFSSLDLRNVRQLALASIAQVVILSAIYFVEIHSLMPHASYLQTLAYTGAANFALFVSLTPGAIGFRESFLVFSQHLHHIGDNIIAAASVMDRGVYILMLLLMAAAVFGLHANDYLGTRKLKKAAKTTEQPLQ